MNNNQDKMKILHLNIRSIKSTSKQLQLKHLIARHEPEIISLNETYLTDKSTLIIEGYNIIRADRINKMGGGAAICIKSNLSFKEIYLGNISKQDDACGIKISSNRQQLSIFSIYSPPNAPLNQAMFENILANHKNAIIIGDLNGRNKLWHCRKENKYGKI